MRGEATVVANRKFQVKLIALADQLARSGEGGALRIMHFQLQLPAIPLSGDSAMTTPRFRFVLGVRWAPLSRDTDGDGVPDTTDKCPSTPASGTEDGCPAPASPGGSTAPAIDLHLGSAIDACEEEPDLVDGFRREDGCPDDDQDKDGIDDRWDQCPLVPEDFVGRTDGCPEKR